MNVLDLIEKALAPARPEDPFATLTRAISTAAGKTFGNKDQKIELRKKQAAYDECERQIGLHTHDKVKDAWLAHQADLQAAVEQGTLDKLDAYSRAEFAAEYDAKMEGAKSARKAVTMSCAKIVEELSEDFANTAEKFAGEQAKTEADAYARFGLPYPGPSGIVKALRQAADQARGNVPRGPSFSRSPREMVPFVNF